MITRLRPTAIGQQADQGGRERHREHRGAHAEAHQYLGRVEDVTELRQKRLGNVQVQKRAEAGDKQGHQGGCPATGSAFLCDRLSCHGTARFRGVGRIIH